MVTTVFHNDEISWCLLVESFVHIHKSHDYSGEQIVRPCVDRIFVLKKVDGELFYGARLGGGGMIATAETYPVLVAYS